MTHCKNDLMTASRHTDSVCCGSSSIPNDDATDHFLFRTKGTRVAELVAEQPHGPTWRGVTRSQIAQQIWHGGCSISSVARAIGLTPRTLLRRLTEEGTTFRDELEAVRREQALAYLRETTLSMTQLACLLDFNTVASFHRAFRRWIGMTPGDYRRKVSKGAGEFHRDSDN